MWIVGWFEEEEHDHDDDDEDDDDDASHYISILPIYI